MPCRFPQYRGNTMKLVYLRDYCHRSSSENLSFPMHVLSCVSYDQPTNNKTHVIIFANANRSFFAGKRADLSDWFVKQENEYEEPQTLFEFVASSYDLAERKKAAKSVICEECGKSFSRLDSLRRHEKNYCRVKGDRMYCRFCGKKFAKPLSLISHVKSAHSTLFLKSQTS